MNMTTNNEYDNWQLMELMMNMTTYDDNDN